MRKNLISNPTELTKFKNIANKITKSSHSFVFDDISLHEDTHEYLILFEDKPLTVDILDDFCIDIKTITKKQVNMLEAFYILVIYCQIHNQFYTTNFTLTNS